MRVCLVYPNIYSLGMSNLGFQMVYHLLNGMDGCVCERAFLPDEEDFEELQRSSTRLFSMESQTPLKDFDIIAFSAPFEEDYTNIIKILALSGIAPLSKARGMDDPLLVTGGVAASLNPEPLADIIDVFLIGEGEGMTEDLLSVYRHGREKDTKEGLLRAFDALDWAFVPSLYEHVYEGSKIKEIKRLEGAKPEVRAAKRFDLESFPLPENFIKAPGCEFRDTSLIEIERGCGRGCRFCAAGFLYLPPRWRRAEKVKESVKRSMEELGKAGLIGTAVSEYPEIKEVLGVGVSSGGSITLSSLRLDRLDGEFINLLKEAGYKTVTLAPEAGSERMRNIINKGLADEDILGSVRLITEAGFLKIKLYFIIGLPGEEDSDAEGIVELVKRIREEMKKGEVVLSVNPFIPKPFTPFQWHPFERPEVIEKRLQIVKKGLVKTHGVTVKMMSAREALVQAYIARADRRAGEVIIDAAARGWKKALSTVDYLQDALYRPRDKDEILPWDIIDHGIRKNYFWKEYRKGLEERLTPPCDVGNCYRCGVCSPEFLKGE